eukprot:6277764-Lingulodinium_polyedra.AAC.1
MALAPITQNAGFIKKLSTTIFPTILTMSSFFDLKRGRLVAAAELWLVQGFPHPAMASKDIAGDFPLQDLVRCPGRKDSLGIPRMTDQEQRIRMGNSMHWCQIGSWFCFNLLCADKAL